MHHEPTSAATGSTAGHWTLTLVLAAVAVTLYLTTAARAQRRLHRPWRPGRAVSWIVGVVLVTAAVSPPLWAFAHEHPTGHMVQHLLLGMFAPLALVLSAPITVLLGAASPLVRARIGAVLGSPVVHVLSHPATAALLNVGGLYVLYLTPVYALTMGSPVLHVLVNVHFLLAGCLFAWAIAGPDAAPRRPGMATRLVVLFLSAASHGYLAKLLYASAERLPPGARHTAAQIEQAAVWMYYGGDVAEILLAVALFVAWYRGRVPVRAGSTRRVGGAGRVTLAPRLLGENPAAAP